MTPSFNSLRTSPSLHTAIVVPSSRFLFSTASLRPRHIASSCKRSSTNTNGTDYSRNPGKGSETNFQSTLFSQSFKKFEDSSPLFRIGLRPIFLWMGVLMSIVRNTIQNISPLSIFTLWACPNLSLQ